MKVKSIAVFSLLILFLILSGCSSSNSSGQYKQCSDGSKVSIEENCPDNDGLTEPIENPTKPKNTITEPEKTEKTASIGEIVNVDNLSYKVTKAESFKEMGSSFFKEETDGKFVKIYIEINNNSNKSQNVFSNRLIIIDGKGREFDPFPGASLYIVDAISFGQQLQPGLTLKGAEVFELPEDASNLKLEISGDWLSISKVTVTLETITDIGKDTTQEEESKEQLEEIYNQCIPPFECTSSCDEFFSQGQKDCQEGQVCCMIT